MIAEHTLNCNHGSYGVSDYSGFLGGLGGGRRWQGNHLKHQDYQS